MHIGANVNPVGPEWADVCMTSMLRRESITVAAQLIGGPWCCDSCPSFSRQDGCCNATGSSVGGS